MEKVGKDGVVTVEEGKGLDFETEYTEGMQIDRGYISPYFVTNTERMAAEFDEPFILITDKKISAIADILPALEQVARAGARLSSSPRMSMAKPSPPWSSTSCAAPSTSSRSKRRASATAARKCSATSPF